MLQGLKCFYYCCLSMKLQEVEVKDKTAKIEHAEQRLTTINLELKVIFVFSRSNISHKFMLLYVFGVRNSLNSLSSLALAFRF